MAVRGVVMWMGLRKEELEQRREVEALVVWDLWRRIGRRTAAEEEGGDWGLMVVVTEEIRAATAAMGSGNGKRFQKEKSGEDSIGDGVVGRRKGTFLIHLRYADIRKLKIKFFFFSLNKIINIQIFYF